MCNEEFLSRVPIFENLCCQTRSRAFWPLRKSTRAPTGTHGLMLASRGFKSLHERMPSIAIRLLEALGRRLRVADVRLAL